MDVNKKDLASVFGISERSFTEYQKDPAFPIKKHGGRGRQNVYDTAQVYTWLVNRALAGAENETQRERLDRISADLKEVEYAEKVGQLVPISQVEPEWTAMVMACRSELLHRDDKLKTELDTLYGIETDIGLLNEHTRNALEHLSGLSGDDQGAEGESVQAV